MDFLPSPRAARKTQVTTTEWNSSGTYSRHPILLSMRYPKARPRWLGSLVLAVVAGCVGLTAGLLQPGRTPAPAVVQVPAVAPAVAVAAPAVSGAAAPAAVPPAAAAVPSAPKRSRKADKALELGWDAYGHGRYDRSKELALEALETAAAEHGTPAQRAQARGLLEQSLHSMQQPELIPRVVRVRAPEPALAPQAVPALVQEPVIESAPAAITAPRVAPDPATLPSTSYPRANPAARHYTWRSPVRRAPARTSVVLPPVVRFPTNTAALPPGMAYPTGRGPNECPNYLTVDDCECHQYESNAWGSLNRNYNTSTRTFGGSRQASRMEAWRRSESLLGRGQI